MVPTGISQPVCGTFAAAIIPDCSQIGSVCPRKRSRKNHFVLILVFIDSAPSPTTPDTPTTPFTSTVTTPDAPTNTTPTPTISSGSSSNTATAAPSSAAETSAAPTSTGAAESTTSIQQTTSSAAPTTTSTSTTPSSTAVSTTATSETSSSVVTTSSTSTSSTTPVSSTATSTSAPVTSIATSATSAATTSTVPRTSLFVSGSYSLGLTTSNGVVYTNTVIVGGTSSATAGASTKKSFFQNTGAVVGVLVVVGIVVTAPAVLIVTVFIRRRRANQFDKEVQEAAREPARAQAPIDDDDDYAGGTSYNTHSSQPMNTERQGGYGYGGASGWDPYGRSAAAGAGGFEMQHRRTSTGTAPGMAGFAAGDVFARNVGLDQSQGYNSNQGYGQGYGQQGYAQDGYNTGYGQGYGSNQSYTSYNNTSPPQSHAHTSPPQSYALAQPQGQQQAGRAPIQAQMMMPEAQRQSYNTVGAFRSSPSYGQAHPGEQVEYGNVAEVNNAARGYNGNNNNQQGGYASGQAAQPDYAPRQSEDAYGGYEPYDVYAEPGPSQAPSGNPPAYAVGAAGTAGATGDRKGGAALARRQSGATRYSAEEDSDEDSPPRRVLKVANQ